MSAMSVGVKTLLLFVISWMIIHFGKNPVSGGRPPKDIMIVKIIMVMNGSLFHICDNEAVVVVELIMSSVKVVTVIGI